MSRVWSLVRQSIDEADPRHPLRYGYYRYSGAKEAVDTARAVSNSAKQAKEKIADLSPSSTKEALGLAKSLAKSYASAIPGGAVMIDQGFNQLESFIDTHGERAAQVVKETYADIEKAAKEGGDKGEAVMKALQEAATKVQNLVGEEAGKGWQALGEKYPELQKTLGGQGEELKKLADKQCVVPVPPFSSARLKLITECVSTAARRRSASRPTFTRRASSSSRRAASTQRRTRASRSSCSRRRTSSPSSRTRLAVTPGTRVPRRPVPSSTRCRMSRRRSTRTSARSRVTSARTVSRCASSYSLTPLRARC